MFKETFCHSGLHNRIMFCLMGSLRDSNHLRSTLVVYQRSGTPHREMTHECWWAMFARLIWVMFTCLLEKHLPSWMFIWLPCICVIWTVVLFTVISKHHAWTFRWHHGATSTIRQVMLLQTKLKKPLEKWTVDTGDTHESVWVSKMTTKFLGCCEWLPGCCYVVSKKCL